MSYVIDGVTYYTIRFLNERGSSEWGRCDVEEGGDATPLAPTPKIREGKVFIGWNHDITHVMNDKTVWAVYANVYTVRFLNYEGTDLLSSQTVIEGEDAIAPEPEVIEGMEFIGWNTDFTNVHEDITVRPLYESLYVTVRFLNKDRTDLLSEQQVLKGEDAIAPAPEIVDGFYFIGWSASYRNVTVDTTIYPLYRTISPRPALNFYKKNPDNTTGEHIRSYYGVNGCTFTQKLDGVCEIDIKLLTRMLENYVGANDIVEVEDFVFYITEVKKNITSGVCFTELSGEHISYILNNDEYLTSAFEMTGTPKQILDELLSDTPLVSGYVEPTQTVTLIINRECTRRALVMQLLALVDGEIEYSGYTIGIRNHVGSASEIDVMKRANVTDISYSYNSTEQRYSFSLELYQKGSLKLGDELRIKFDPFGINIHRRLVGMEWNPFNYKEVNITVGAYMPTVNDSLYQLVTTVEDITVKSSKYTMEFGEIIGNGSFFFTRSYSDRPYFQVQTNDGTTPVVTLTRKSGSSFNPYIGASLSGVNSDTVTLVVFYLTVPLDDEVEKDGII